MDIRCTSCNKLFRVADEKIAGKGIRFKCTRCGQVITVTRDDFEMDKLSREAEAVPEMAPALAPESQTGRFAPPTPQSSPASQEERTQEMEQEQQQEQEQEHQEQEPAAAAALQSAPAPFQFDFQEPDLPQTEQQPFGDFAGNEFDAGQPAAGESSSSFLDIPSSDAPSQQAGGKGVPDEVGGSAAAKFQRDDSANRSFGLEAAESRAEVAAVHPASDSPVSERPAVQESPKERAGRPAPLQDAARPLHKYIHPVPAGIASGLSGGLGCALPVAALLIFGMSMVTRFVPMLAQLPLLRLALMVGSGIVSTGIMIGLLLALVQAKSGRKLFFLLNILIGSLAGAVASPALTVIMALAQQRPIAPPELIASALSGGIAAFCIALSVVLFRRILIGSSVEKFGASFSKTQGLGVVIALLIIGLTVYLQATFYSAVRQSMASSGAGTAGTVTTEGLQITSPQGWLDPANGDLVLTGTVENSLDREKTGWFVLAEVYDLNQRTLVRAKLLNGKQVYSGRDYQIFSERGVNVQEIMKRQLQDAGLSIPAHGSVQFEIRVMAPPAGSTSFNMFLQAYDPMLLFKEMTDEMQQQRQ